MLGQLLADFLTKRSNRSHPRRTTRLKSLDNPSLTSKVEDTLIIEQNVIDRFWSKVDRSGGSDACWLWKAGISSRGYGKYRFEGRTQPAHRVAWHFTNGAITTKLLCCHKCDVRACCNPRHLFLGTHTENMLDMVSKARHPRAQLTVKIVELLRQAAVTEGKTAIELAEKLGLSYEAVVQAIRGSTWRHVGGPTRRWRVNGERNPKAKLSEKDVREIRQRRTEGHRLGALAKKFSVCEATISGICCRTIWKHVP